MADNSTKLDLKALFQNEKFKKVFSIVKTVLFWLIIAFAAFMMVFTIISVNMFDKNDRNIFGYRMLIVKSDSMKATHFDAGDLIFVKEVDVRDLNEGDVISFISQGKDNYGEVVTHRIRTKTTDEDGSIAFVTYGTTTNKDDEALATVILGKYVGKLPKMGTFFNFMRTTPGYIVCILVPFMLLIIWQGSNSVVLFIKYRKEQRAEMDAERQKIEQDKAETQKMMEELLALKAQLASQNAQPKPTDQDDQGSSDNIE